MQGTLPPQHVSSAPFMRMDGLTQSSHFLQPRHSRWGSQGPCPFQVTSREKTHEVPKLTRWCPIPGHACTLALPTGHPPDCLPLSTAHQEGRC